jgi:hypothetical protein
MEEAAMLSKQEEELERRETLENDRKVRERQHRDLAARGTTFHQFARADLEIPGRFAVVNKAELVGNSEAARYPAASSAHQTQLPDEPPFGVAIDDEHFRP